MKNGRAIARPFSFHTVETGVSGRRGHRPANAAMEIETPFEPVNDRIIVFQDLERA